jgi:hypothetical protein
MIDLAVRAIEPRVRIARGSSVARPNDANYVCIPLRDQTIQVRENEIQSGGRSPMAQEPLLDMFAAKWLPQEWILLQVDLADCQIIRSTPVPVHAVEQFLRQRTGRPMSGPIR